MRNGSAILAQGVIGTAAALLAVFCPQPGSASRLVPMPNTQTGKAGQWAAEEGAQLIAYDPEGQSVTVIAPSALGLMCALAYGFVPIAADSPSCAGLSSRPSAPGGIS